MNKMNSLQSKLSDIHKTIHDLEELIEEKNHTILQIETHLVTLQETHKAEKNQLEEYTKKLDGYRGLMKETENYYNQIEQNIDTLMTIITSYRD
jgi:chromosome segregation ATPase